MILKKNGCTLKKSEAYWDDFLELTLNSEADCQNMDLEKSADAR